MKNLLGSQFRFLNMLGSDLARAAVGQHATLLHSVTAGLAPHRALSDLFGSDLTKGMVAARHESFAQTIAKGMLAAQHESLAQTIAKGMLAAQPASQVSEVARGIVASQQTLFTSVWTKGSHTQLASEWAKGMLASHQSLVASDLVKGAPDPRHTQITAALTKHLSKPSYSIYENVSSAISAELSRSSALKGVFGADLIKHLSPSYRSIVGAALGADAVFGRGNLLGSAPALPAVRMLDAVFSSVRLQGSLAPDSPITLLLRDLDRSFELGDQRVFFEFFNQFISDLADQAAEGPSDPDLRLEQLRRLQELWAFALSYLAPILLLLSAVVILASNRESVAFDQHPEAQAALQEPGAPDAAAEIEALAEVQRRTDELAQRMLDTFRQAYEDACFDKGRIQKEGLPASCYVVQRRTQLYAKPSPGAKTAGILFPNETVKLVERKGKWVRISYYDLLAGDVRSGWVLKKYMKGESAR